MTEPTPRQVLYALVAGGFLAVVGVLVVGGAVVGIAPTWWTVSMGAFVGIAGVWMAFRWRRTGPVLVVGIGLFLLWMVGTLVVSGR